MIDSIGKSTCTERGALVITALVIMLALLILGSLTTMIVVAERNISRNHKMAKNVFYLADGGYPLAVKIIEDIIRGTSGIPYQGFTIAENLRNEILDYHQDNTSLNDKHLDSPRNAPDVKGSLWGGQVVRIDIDRSHTTLVYGGSAEFASGGEGIGLGGGASKKLLFEVTTEGSLQGSACANVVTVYRSVL